MFIITKHPNKIQVLIRDLKFFFLRYKLNYLNFLEAKGYLSLNANRVKIKAGSNCKYTNV